MLDNALSYRVDVERGPGWLLVRVRDLETSGDAADLADQLWEIATRHFTYRMVVDLDQLPLLDSQLVGQLLQLQARLAERNGMLRLCGVSPSNRRVLRACNADKHLIPYRTREEAILGCYRPNHPR